MSEVLQKAEERMKELVKEMRKIDQFIRVYRSLSAETQKDIERPIIKKITPMNELHSLASEAIKAYGKPMPLNELFKVLQHKGCVFGGHQPKGNLSAKLYHAEELRLIKGEGWWLKSWAEKKPLNVVQ